ncbi:MAG TPA: hypothetical protein VK691_01290 [Solirubrobacteraceae bacterium]|jgi:hypothetical protein|nr:hypothetical protein [Solirubrobacteraceae bacterium]
MEHRSQIPMKIVLDGKSVRSETLATSVGAYILVLETVLPDQAIDLHSIYTGHANARTQATHLVLTPDLRQATTVEHDHDTLPVTHSRRTCLYDHLHQLQSLLQDHGIDVQFPIEDDAIAAVEH